MEEADGRMLKKSAHSLIKLPTADGEEFEPIKPTLTGSPSSRPRIKILKR